MPTKKKAKSSPYVEDGPTFQIDPNRFKSDFRAFCADSGISSGGGLGTDETLVYTVPSDRVLNITDIYNLTDGLTVVAVTRLEIADQYGNVIWKIYANGAITADNVLENPLKLLAGDTIKLYYRSADAAGTFSFCLIGMLELDILKLGLY